MAKFDEEKAKALFLLSGFNVIEILRLENLYWPNTVEYFEVRKDSPWFIMRTDAGLIRLGWRKRVLEINWESTDFRVTDEIKITDDDTTQTETLVHAWNYSDAVRYLTALRIRLHEKPMREATVETY